MKNGDMEGTRGDTPSPLSPNSSSLPVNSSSLSMNSPSSSVSPVPASPSSFSAYSQTKGTATKVKSFMMSKLNGELCSRQPPNSTPSLPSRPPPLPETNSCRSLSPLTHLSSHGYTKPCKTSPLSSPVSHPNTYMDAKPCKTSPLSSPVSHPSTYMDAKPCKTSPLSSPVPKPTPHRLELMTNPCMKSPVSSPVSVISLSSSFLDQKLSFRHSSQSPPVYSPNPSSRPMPPLQPLNNSRLNYQSLPVLQPPRTLTQSPPLSLCMPRPQTRSPPQPQPRSPLLPPLPKKRPRSETFEEGYLESPPASPGGPDSPFFSFLTAAAPKRKAPRWSVASPPIIPTPSPSITSSPPLSTAPAVIPALIRMPQEVCSEVGGLASFTSTLAAAKEWEEPNLKTPARLPAHRSSHSSSTPTHYPSQTSALIAAHPGYLGARHHHNAHHQVKRLAHTPSRNASLRPSVVPPTHPSLPHSYYRELMRLKEAATTSPVVPHQGLSPRLPNTWSGGAMLPHPRHPSITAGNQNSLLPSDMHLQYTGHSPTVLGQPERPSAAFKIWHHPNEEKEFDKKDVSEWVYKDFVQFIFTAYNSLDTDQDAFDLDFSKVSNAVPPLKLEESLFKQISKKHGEVLYRYFQNFLECKREREAQAQQAKFCSQNRISPSGYTVESEGASRHQSLQDSSVALDTPARYEIRYETLEDKRHGFDAAGMMGLPQGMAMPSAALKPFPNILPQTSMANQNGTLNPDHSTHEEVKPEVPKKRGPGRPRKPESERKNKKKKTGRLWEFIRNLLLDPSTCPSLVRWENAEEGMFRFIQAEKVAQKWGDRKKNGEMNYEKLSRAMRYYYKTQIFEAVLGRRLVYKFGKNAKNWRPTNPSDPNFQEYHQQYQAG